jgi:hypothetical protein
MTLIRQVEGLSLLWYFHCGVCYMEFYYCTFMSLFYYRSYTLITYFH